ncbi:MAG: asparaginase domain-containing protein [Chloroflexota bacterium]
MMAIKIFTTGGSIDKYYSTQHSTFLVGEPQIGAILQEAGVTVAYEIEPLFRKDSLELTDSDRELILSKVKADPHPRIIITHGTDTLVQTAQTLSQVKGKVIVLMGAMQPAAFKRSDAAFNVGCALSAVQTLPEGVYVVMNGRVFSWDHVTKNPTCDRFEEI